MVLFLITDHRSALIMIKGLILFEELLRASSQDSSNKMKLIISIINLCSLCVLCDLNIRFISKICVRIKLVLSSY